VGARPRLLLAKASAVWLWPGISLTERRGVTIQPVSPEAMHFWLSKFLGPEIVGQPVPMHVANPQRRKGETYNSLPIFCDFNALGQTLKCLGVHP
jgi:hypothetical protein